MKFIHTADWHIGRSLCGVSLLEDQRHFLNQLADYLAKERPDALLISGDLYDRPVPSAEAMKLLDEFFCRAVLELGIPVLAVAGNHDSGERLSYERDFLARAGLHVAGVLSDPVETVTLSDEYGPVQFHLLPWVEPAAVNSLEPDEPRVRTMQEAFDRMAAKLRANIDSGARQVLLCHGFFEGGAPLFGEEELGGAELVSLAAFADFDYIAAGHIHRRMPLGKNARYSGSILKYSPREAANVPAVLVIELAEKGSLRVAEQVFQPRHDLKRVSGQFSELLDGPPSDDYIFAELTDRELILDPARRLKTRFPNLLGVSYREQERQEAAFTVRTEDAQQLTVPELFSRFYEDVAQVPLSAAAKEAVATAAEQAQQRARLNAQKEAAR